jgi:hypothetical protein
VRASCPGSKTVAVALLDRDPAPEVGADAELIDSVSHEK